MARTIETIVHLTDDLDGTKATETVSFGFDGTDYEIDLSAKNRRALDKLMAPYVEAARTVRTPKSGAGAGRKPARRSAGQPGHAAVRAWAQESGLTVNDRGRVPTELIEQYRAAH